MEATRLIRDAYTFKRGFPAPVVKLVTMDRAECYEQRQRQVGHQTACQNLLGSLPFLLTGGSKYIRSKRVIHLK